jgi:signal transduction histidine kinase
LSKYRTPAVKQWCLASFVFGLGLMLVGMRQSVPELLTYPVANFCVWFSSFMLMRALSIELGLVFKWRWMLFLCLAGLLFFEVLRSKADLEMYRFMVTLCITLFAFTGVAIYALRIYQAERFQSALWIMAVYGLAALGLLYRVCALILEQPKLIDLLSPSASGAITLATGMLAAIFGNMGYVGLYLERTYKRDKEVAIENERLHAREKLSAEFANLDRQRSMAEMAAALAHELSQPLTAAKMDCETLEIKIENYKTLNEVLKVEVAALHKSIDRAVKIVTRIHNFIKSREPKLEKVRWHEIYADVNELLPKSERKSSSRIDWISTVPIQKSWVHADSVQLSQVLLNLLRNALQSSVANRPLQILVKEDLLEDQICLSIIDNGKGLDAANIDRALQSFYSTKNDGLGVGLAICHSILEQHGGKLYVESNLGKGTCVKCFIPVWQSEFK